MNQINFVSLLNTTETIYIALVFDMLFPIKKTRAYNINLRAVQVYFQR